MLVTLRRVYVYVALTIALLATGFASIFLIQVGLQALGLREGDLSPSSVRESVAGGIAILVFALPVGGLHLWFAQRGIRDEAEARSWPRHLVLNALIVFGLVMATTAVFGLTAFLFRWPDRDMVAMQSGTLLFVIAGTIAVWRWREQTPSTTRIWQTIAAFATLAIATVLAVGPLSDLAAAFRSLAQPELKPPVPLAAAFIPVAAVGAMWAIGLRWQWPWRDGWFRSAYSAALFAIGLAVLTRGLVDQIAALVSQAGAPAVVVANVTAPWERLLVGAVLVSVHLGWVLADKGTTRAPIVTDRTIAVIAAGCGLATLFVSWLFTWMWLSDLLRDAPVTASRPQPSDFAIAAFAVGALLFAPGLVALLRSTAGTPESVLRRGYLFGAIGLALLTTLVTGSFAAYNGVSLALGGTEQDFARDAARFAGYGGGAVIALVAHVLWLRADLARSAGRLSRRPPQIRTTSVHAPTSA